MVRSSNHFTNSCIIESSPFMKKGYCELTYKFFLVYNSTCPLRGDC
jgi:hypothetical protein